MRGEDAKYHMVASRWPSGLSFEPHWLTNSEIVRAVSDRPTGPFKFAEIVLPARGGSFWDDAHTDLTGSHTRMCGKTDKPIAGLLRDLKALGLLDSTLVVWGGEFGRTPLAQGQNGRDHHPYGFTTWLAGGGVKGGQVLGATDEFGVRAAEMRVDSRPATPPAAARAWHKAAKAPPGFPAGPRFGVVNLDEG